MQTLSSALPDAVPTINSTMQLKPVHRLDMCPACGGLGIIGWKTPRHYPLSEVKFCECAYGDFAKAAEHAKAAKVQQERLKQAFGRAGIPAHFHGLTIDTLAAVAGTIPTRPRLSRSHGRWSSKACTRTSRACSFSAPDGCGKTGALMLSCATGLTRDTAAYGLSSTTSVRRSKASTGKAMRPARQWTWCAASTG